MEKKASTLFRKCSPALAAGAGAALCLTSGMGNAAVVTGNISASNGGASVFGTGEDLWAFLGQAHWSLVNTGGGRIMFSLLGFGAVLNGVGGYIVPHAAGVTVSTGIVGGFADGQYVPNSLSDVYFAARFTWGGYRYGWIHVVSTNASGSSMTLGTWGYDSTGASIKTLSDSVTAKKLDLAGGESKLHWTNVNEQGVARYAVEVKGQDGAWAEVDGDAPGAGSYSAKVSGEGTYRLAVEKIDGTTDHIDF